MTILAHVFVMVAVALQVLNVIWVVQGVASRKAKSQVVVVPCLLWYVALAIRGECYFASSRAIEIAVVVLVHVVLTATLAAISSRYR